MAFAVPNAPAVRAQTTPAPKFDVASIRQIGAGERWPAGCAAVASPGRLVLCTNVGVLIRNAYSVFAEGRRNAVTMPVTVEGGPSWMAEAFTIQATAGGEASPEMMQGPMMQALLEDRFKLKLRRELRQVPVYDLNLAKDSSKLRPHLQGNCTPVEPGTQPPTSGPGEKPVCKGVLVSRNGSTVSLEGDFTPAQTFVNGLYGIGATERPIMNRTGLTQLFDLHLEFAAVSVSTGTDPLIPSIFTVLQEQLGLRLDPAKGQQEFLIVEGLERPSEN